MNINPTEPFTMKLTELHKVFEPQDGSDGPACAVLGPNPMSFPWGYDEDDEDCYDLKQALKKEIMCLTTGGIENFWIACDPGVGLWCGEFINTIQKEFWFDISLHCYVPYEEHANKWHQNLRERYYSMLMSADSEHNDSGRKTPSARLDAYKAIIDKADVLLVVHDDSTKKTDQLDEALEYAKAQKKSMIIIHPVAQEGFSIE
ncbi:MAG: SLOG family protein [Rikenellaceae bacterium]